MDIIFQLKDNAFDAKDIDEAKDECAKRDGFLTLRIDPSKNVIQQLENFFERFNDANGET